MRGVGDLFDGYGETARGLTEAAFDEMVGRGGATRSPYAGVASIFASGIANGQPPRVYEDGGQLRDFVHVRDVARANVLALYPFWPENG